VSWDKRLQLDFDDEHIFTVVRYEDCLKFCLGLEWFEFSYLAKKSQTNSNSFGGLYAAYGYLSNNFDWQVSNDLLTHRVQTINRRKT
jgi:hypothetical protein